MRILIFLTMFISLGASAAGLDYLINGITTPVKVDTVTPANSRPYPFSYYGSSGTRVDLMLDSTGQTINTSVLGVDTTLQSIDFATETTLASVLADTATMDISLSSIDGKLGSLGQKNMAGSAPVVIASDQSTLNVNLSSQTGNIVVDQGTNPWIVDGSAFTQPISAVALPLPSGASTSSLQTSGNASLTSIDGKLPATLGQKTSANSLAVTISSDQSAIQTRSPINPNGSTATNTTLTTTAQTLTAPANAVGFKIYALDTNTANLRMTIGATATVSTGIQLQPGRSEDFNIASNVSVIAESGTGQGVVIVWALNQ